MLYRPAYGSYTDIEGENQRHEHHHPAFIGVACPADACPVRHHHHLEEVTAIKRPIVRMT